MLLDNIYFENYTVVNFVNATEIQHQQILTARNKIEIRRWMYNQNIISEAEHQTFLQRLQNDSTNLYWGVFSEKGELIGVICLNKLNFIHKNAFLGIYTNVEHKLRGKGKILMTILKKISFEYLCLHTLKLEVICDNTIAINFYTTEHFIQEGILKQYVFINDTWKDVIIMGIINNGD